MAAHLQAPRAANLHVGKVWETNLKVADRIPIHIPWVMVTWQGGAWRCSALRHMPPSCLHHRDEAECARTALISATKSKEEVASSQRGCNFGCTGNGKACWDVKIQRWAPVTQQVSAEHLSQARVGQVLGIERKPGRLAPACTGLGPH